MHVCAFQPVATVYHRPHKRVVAMNGPRVAALAGGVRITGEVSDKACTRMKAANTHAAGKVHLAKTAKEDKTKTAVFCHMTYVYTLIQLQLGTGSPCHWVIRELGLSY